MGNAVRGELFTFLSHRSDTSNQSVASGPELKQSVTRVPRVERRIPKNLKLFTLFTIHIKNIKTSICFCIIYWISHGYFQCDGDLGVANRMPEVSRSAMEQLDQSTLTGGRCTVAGLIYCHLFCTEDCLHFDDGMEPENQVFGKT